MTTYSSETSTHSVEDREEGPERIPRPKKTSRLLEYAERYGLLGILVVEVIFFIVKEPATFGTTANFRIIATSISVLAVTAMALIFPLLAGRFDVSVGAVVCGSAVTCASFMSHKALPLVPAILATLVIGALLGTINGVIVAYFGVNSMIATIGTGTVLQGIVQGYTSGLPVQANLSHWLAGLGNNDVFGIPVLFLIALGICLIAWYVMTQVPFGRHLIATGSNLNAATLNGIPARRIVLLSFMVAGLLGACAGVMQIGAQGSGDPNINGITFLLPALAAVFLGATTFQPGRFNVAGTILALIFIGTTSSGLILVGLKPWVTDVFNGSAVVIAMAISAEIRRRRTGSIAIG